jgi:sigma-B regulation protein RsbU (phosphoserine phosphatase)
MPDELQRYPAQSIYDQPWQKRLELIVDTMREMSRQTEPNLMVQAYARRLHQLMGYDRLVSVSRRNVPEGRYRITRSTMWKTQVNPWQQPDQLPEFEGGLFGQMIYGEEPVIIDDLRSVVAPDDPAAEYFAGMGSLQAIPQFDGGRALNMAVTMCEQPRAFNRERLPEHVWMSNLFGRATHSLVLSAQLKRAYEIVDRELRAVGDIQRSLLPTELPVISGLNLAAHYQTSMRAGGDYYDFFPLPGGRWGILMADVSGHGTPAAVLMAVTHSIAHSPEEHPDPPSKLLGFVNRQLASKYTNGNGTFVTAFYGVYDPSARTIVYSRAGHPPPRVKCACDGRIRELDGAPGLPLGIDGDEVFEDAEYRFDPGDTAVFYTDGITEARQPRTSELFETSRLDAEIARDNTKDPETLIRSILIAVEDFMQDTAPVDDMTLLVARVG